MAQVLLNEGLAGLKGAGRRRERRRPRPGVGVDSRNRRGHHDHMVRRVTVGARELKTRLGGYLQQVRQGRTLVITDRGEPVAELRPLRHAGTDAKLEQLQALGAVTWVEKRPLAPFRPVRSHGPSVSDAILEDRDDRV